MRQQTRSPKEPAEKVVQDIRRATRKHYSAEEKIRIVLEGLRGEDSIAELCRREGIAQNLYYRPFSPFFPLRARARGERRFQTATAISFLCLAGRQPLVPAAERAAARAAELRRRRRWPPGPPICRYGSRCCARSGKRCPLVLSFPFALAREASAESRR